MVTLAGNLNGPNKLLEFMPPFSPGYVEANTYPKFFLENKATYLKKQEHSEEQNELGCRYMAAPCRQGSSNCVEEVKYVEIKSRKTEPYDDGLCKFSIYF